MAPAGGTAVQDHVALAEIELCGELIIAASAARGDRLSPDRIDEVLRVGEECASDTRPDTRGDTPERRAAQPPSR
ncbi:MULTISPECIES: hypothetical protein [Streptomyces]|uniref:hypothetical protein n=1 Tax=Streptomyces TaxID=1883 RepID=UPI001E2F4B7F|nr:hypothetical protein [Streptomyces ruber]